MTTVSVARELAPFVVDSVPGAPPAEVTVAPATLEDVARVLDCASGERLRVLVWGGGTHQGYGQRFEPNLVISTARLARLIDWQPEDLTVVAEAGMPVARLEEQMAERGQSAVLTETRGPATVGGVVAAGISGWRRSRYGPTRDRLLEVTLVTGDGRVVRGGGRVVKNVTGYDLCRLAAGSLGGLGVVGAVCLKLWPFGSAAATVTIDSAEVGLVSAYRPLAIIEEEGVTRCFLQGTEREVEAQTAALGGDIRDGLDWPTPISGEVVWSLRVSPGLTRAAVERCPRGWSYQAQFGVGEVRLAAPEFDPDEAASLRAWAEADGGALVLVEGPDSVYDAIDPWGAPPQGLEIQRRIVARFDPARVINPGRLPGGL